MCSARKRRGRPSSQYQSLESRKMFANMSIEVVNDLPQLVIDGTNGMDEVIVSDYSTPQIVVGEGDPLPPNDHVIVSFSSQYEKVVDGERVGMGSAGSRIFAKSDFERIRFLGRSGDDTFVNNTEIDSAAYGHAGNDTLKGGQGNNWIQGGSGNDIIRGGDRNDLLRGRDGNDQIYGGKRHDRIFGGNGNDLIVAGAGNDFVKSDSGQSCTDGSRRYYYGCKISQ